MALAKKEMLIEEKKLAEMIEKIKDELSNLGQKIYDKEEKILEFRKFTWDNKSALDPAEMRSIMTNDELEAQLLMAKGRYFQKLFKIQSNPYFASIIFEDEQNKEYEIYMGITYLKDKTLNNILYDWRSPICSLFYDYEIGEAQYEAPEGIIKGLLKRKRQYKIQNNKLKMVFDNSLNINDELLQEVLATESSEKMKNIVNTIQQEQNNVIRNITDKNLIVQGIAGSGKTSVALHRIAFLLYKIKNLTSNNILIFSPNQIFTEYISNVLPELGEENTLQTTFHDFLGQHITEYKIVESFVGFIARYYTYNEINPELVKYKQSDDIIIDFDNYIKDYIENAKFINGFIEGNINEYSKDELNYILIKRYDKLPLFERITMISNKLSENNYHGSRKKAKTYHKLIMASVNFTKDYKKIYANFFRSKYCKITVTDKEITQFINKSIINYEDALLLVYLKGQLEGFDYNPNILQVVIDEAQDYNRLQYIIISKIFKRCSFTILGDVNQTINPYYKYNDLESLTDIFNYSSRYLELNKTYRSSPDIIDYTNKILGLNHVSAIRKDNNKPIEIRKNIINLKQTLYNDIVQLQKDYKSIAIITKDDQEALNIYNILVNNLQITLITNKSEEFTKELIVLPSYLSKGLEFDAVIVLNINNQYKEDEKHLLYVSCTRAQHELIIYN